MASGSTSEPLDRIDKQKGQNLGAVQPKLEPFLPRKDHNPRELKSWAKRTGFVSNFSGETTSTSFREHNEKSDIGELDLENGFERNGSSSPKIEIDPVLGRARNRGLEIEPGLGSTHGLQKDGAEPILGEKFEERKIDLSGNGDRNGNGHGVAGTNTLGIQQKKEEENVESVVGIEEYQDGEEPGGQWPRMKCGPKDNPGFVPLIYYGLQHYLSLAGSLILIPLIIVPAMGGTDKDTATVISTMLLVSGITTILHSYFGTRLPLVQGSSFVYLAPALVIVNSQEYRNLTEHAHNEGIARGYYCWFNFPKHPGFQWFDVPFTKIPFPSNEPGTLNVRGAPNGELRQCAASELLRYRGSQLPLDATTVLRCKDPSPYRLINPVVVAPTVAAVGLAFFSYGFPQAGSCVEISLPQILLLLIFTLVSMIYLISLVNVMLQVPLSIVIIWAYAFFLTAGGAYSYKGCSSNIPSSNILTDACIKHAYTMKHCRTDVSNAWRTAAWVRIPYPLQWGIPIFHLRTSIIMIVVSLVASVDSVGTYHSASLRSGSKPPTPGIVSRGIGLEGFCSVVAGLWGSGTGSTTLTENVHTIDITKVASRRAVQLGAAFLILFSFVGKVGAVLASIPQALAAATLCFMWALIIALGFLTLQYSPPSNFRNITIVGVSLFLGLSVPAYFQQYQPKSSLILPSYFVPFSAASSGPFHTGSRQLDFSMNALLSLNTVVTLLVAFVLDNSVPGSRQERGVYIWSTAEDVVADPPSLSDYSLPSKVAPYFRW
ncbi:hypothetical protein RJ640_020155, partial [Escallonia rubra]